MFSSLFLSEKQQHWKGLYIWSTRHAWSPAKVPWQWITKEIIFDTSLVPRPSDLRKAKWWISPATIWEWYVFHLSIHRSRITMKLAMLSGRIDTTRLISTSGKAVSWFFHSAISFYHTAIKMSYWMKPKVHLVSILFHKQERKAYLSPDITPLKRVFRCVCILLLNLGFGCIAITTNVDRPTLQELVQFFLRAIHYYILWQWHKSDDLWVSVV